MRRIIVPSIPPDSFEVIPVPAEPIRQTWIRRYRLLEKKLEKLKREWRVFEQDSLAHYQKWYHSTFWSELSKVNDWTEKAREQQRILMAIMAHQQIYRIDELEAYARVQSRLHAKADIFPDAEDIERFEKKQREHEEAAQKRREEIQKRRQAEAEKFWQTEEEAESYAEQLQNAFDRIFEPVPEKVFSKRESDLKTLYRSIVRELHPDTGHEMSLVEKEWWNQTLEAYRNGDIETLKLLALKIQGKGTVSIESVSHIGTLIDLCVTLIQQQDEIENQKRRLKKDPVYRFWTSRTRQTNRDKLTFEIRAQLQHQFRKLKDYVADAKMKLSELDQIVREENQDDEEEYNPKNRKRARLGGRGRGRRRD